MNARALLIEVRWPDGRFHGVRESREIGRRSENIVPEWPPSPFRLFQALVAGAYGGRWAAEGRAEKDAAFAWLERLDPPAISAPPPKTLRPVTYFVPNNDLDAKGGDPDRVADIRTSKTLRTTSFDADRPVAYLWTFYGEDTPAHCIAELTSRLHTLGHGIDAAFADAEVLDAAVAEERLMALGGSPCRPARGRAVSSGTPCPAPGSLESLRQRHEGFTGRFERVGSGRRAVTEFRQPSKAHARAVAYDRAATRRLYELRPIEGDKRFRSWPLARASALVVAVREQIERALGPSWPDEVARLVVGRGASAADISLRLRIVPLPSIGMRHTDPDIRRVLVEAPPDHPIPLNDLDWSLAGRELADVDGALCGIVLTPASDTSMLAHYGVDHGRGAARRWRTVTPAVLPSLVGRDGRSRAAAEAGAAPAIAQALRHAGITTPVTDVRVQREPFDLKGERSDRFSADRFDARDLRHVELTFERPVHGPLVIGDGRWLGLGVMRRMNDRLARAANGTVGLYIFAVSGGSRLGWPDTEAITGALRRAVMARAQVTAGARLKRGESLPSFFTGHPRGVSTDQLTNGHHEHLFYALDAGLGERSARLMVIAPHRADRSAGVMRQTHGVLSWLEEAVDGLTDLRAGRLGRFELAQVEPTDDDHVSGRGVVWTSLTPYHPTRHPKRGQDARDCIVDDLLREAERRGLPRPSVDVLKLDAGPRGGLRAHLRLRFAIAVEGPLLLGKESHFGAGLFGRVQDPG